MFRNSFRDETIKAQGQTFSQIQNRNNSNLKIIIETVFKKGHLFTSVFKI
jgi:hypothetical protein